jgi:hypothetical protein
MPLYLPSFEKCTATLHHPYRCHYVNFLTKITLSSSLSSSSFIHYVLISSCFFKSPMARTNPPFSLSLRRCCHGCLATLHLLARLTAGRHAAAPHNSHTSAPLHQPTMLCARHSALARQQPEERDRGGEHHTPPHTGAQKTHRRCHHSCCCCMPRHIVFCC